MNDPSRVEMACVSATAEFICVDTYSGRGRLGRDARFPSLLLDPRCSALELGGALARALSQSRLLDAEEARTFFNFERMQRQYSEWVSRLMDVHRYPTREALFAQMAQCTATVRDDELTLSPSLHSRLEAWERQEGDGIEDVVIVRGADDGDLGAALRLALARCR